MTDKDEVRLYVKRHGDALLVFDQDGRKVANQVSVEARCELDEINTVTLTFYEVMPGKEGPHSQ